MEGDVGICTYLRWRDLVPPSFFHPYGIKSLSEAKGAVDAHLRWRDLVPPDQTLSEAKGADFDAPVFRNVHIYDKKFAENKILYAVSFANQKHLPVLVTNNILETERTSDGSEKLWFPENYVALYLIKEFEEGSAKSTSSSVMLIPDHLWIYHRKQLQSRRRDIFLYLFLKVEKPAKCCCVSCRRDAFLRNAVRCSTCQGYCHKDCTIHSTVNMGLDRQKTVPNFIYQAGSHQTAPKVEAKSNQIVPTVDKIISTQEMISVSDSTSEKKAKRRGSVETYGLLWNKKKVSDDSGRDFRLQNIVLKSEEEVEEVHNGLASGHMFHLPRLPSPCLDNGPVDKSHQAYHHQYKRSLTTQGPPTAKQTVSVSHKDENWFHALEEAQIFDLIGFKCGKCRRKASPECHYVDPNYRKSDGGPLKEGHAEIKEKAASNCLKITICSS